MKYTLIAKSSLIISTLLGAGLVQAETLSCKLYVSTSTNLTHKISPPSAGSTLLAQRYVGTCHFEDGRIASKQFVGVQRVIGDGSTGTMLGYSTYSLNDKDSISLSFNGGWGSSGFNGDYTVVSGSGSYENAKGSGSFKSAKNSLPNLNVFDVEINLAE